MPTNVFQFLFDLFDDEEARTEQADGQSLPEDITGADILSAIPQVCAALPPEQAALVASAYGIPYEGPDGSGGTDAGGSASVDLPPPPAPQPGESDGDFAQRQINYFTEVVNVTHQTINEGDNVVTNEGGSLVDNSVATNIEAFGDVDFEQDIDNENNLALGADSIASSGSGTNNTGDDAFVVGEDLNNAGTIATGNVGGSVTGNISDSQVVGRDANGSVLAGDDVDDTVVGSEDVINDSEVGAAAFGSGDAQNFEDSNVLSGEGTLQADVSGTANAATNTGSGDQNAAVGSQLNESAVGGSVQSNDIDVDADEGSAVGFGEGDVEADSSTTVIDDVDGNVQIADGDNAEQVAVNDESVEVELENVGNTDNSINESFDDNLVAEDSFNPTEVDVDVDDSLNDNDAVDVG